MNPGLRYILDEQGEPVPCDDITEWGHFYENKDARRVAQDRDEGPDKIDVWISTVFLALDHQYGKGPPILWETMVFGGPLDGEQDRYSSRAAALRGHQVMCERVSAALRGKDSGA